MGIRVSVFMKSGKLWEIGGVSDSLATHLRYMSPRALIIAPGKNCKHIYFKTNTTLLLNMSLVEAVEFQEETEEDLNAEIG